MFDFESFVPELVKEFKQRFRITWADEAEEKLIETYIRSGNSYLKSTALGCDIDYTSDLYAKDLLYSYVLYARSDAISGYREAYSGELLRLRIQYQHSLLRTERENEQQEQLEGGDDSDD